MMKGMPSIPDLPHDPAGLVSGGLDSAISFGGAFAIGLIFGEQWGIFNEYGVPILLADNVTSVEFQRTANIASAPLEKGTFASYNKVQEPFTATVQMTKGGGSSMTRGLFITQIETLAKSTLKFNVLTPEYVHMRAAIVGFSYRRLPDDGNKIIVANLDLKEVREVEVKYSKEEVEKPKVEDDAPSVESGGKTAKPATKEDTSVLVNIDERTNGYLTWTKNLVKKGADAVTWGWSKTSSVFN